MFPYHTSNTSCFLLLLFAHNLHPPFPSLLSIFPLHLSHISWTTIIFYHSKTSITLHGPQITNIIAQASCSVFSLSFNNVFPFSFPFQHLVYHHPRPINDVSTSLDLVHLPHATLSVLDTGTPVDPLYFAYLF